MGLNKTREMVESDHPLVMSGHGKSIFFPATIGKPWEHHRKMVVLWWFNGILWDFVGLKTIGKWDFRKIFPVYPLVLTDIAIENGHGNDMSLPIQNGVMLIQLS